MAEDRTVTDWVAWPSPGALVLVGLASFLLPPPPTSMIGVRLVVVGVVPWLVDAVGGRRSGGERAEV